MELNINYYEPVDYKTSHQFFNIKGYGQLYRYKFNDSKFTIENMPLNKLEPLKGPFGEHLPLHSEKAYLESNPQTTLAWK